MHKFKKSLGQNFLRSSRFAVKLVDAIDPQPSDLIIEVGPGDGKITSILLDSGARVVSVEVDYSLIAPLIMKFGDRENFELINESILDVDISELLAKYETNQYKVVGSLPYNISKQIIHKFITADERPTSVSVIVQEEVAKVYTATSPKATFLSMWIRSHAKVRKLLSIPKTQFYPAPKVNGAIMSISEIVSSETPGLTKLLRVGFKSPRKTLWNNLSSTWSTHRDKLEEVWEQIGFSQNIRAAELELKQWHELAEVLIDKGIMKLGTEGTTTYNS